MIRISRAWEGRSFKGRSEGLLSDRRRAGSQQPVGAIASRLCRASCPPSSRPRRRVPGDGGLRAAPCSDGAISSARCGSSWGGPTSRPHQTRRGAPWDSGGRSRARRLSWGSGRSSRRRRSTRAKGETMAMAHSFSLVRPQSAGRAPRCDAQPGGARSSLVSRARCTSRTRRSRRSTWRRSRRRSRPTGASCHDGCSACGTTPPPRAWRTRPTCNTALAAAADRVVRPRARAQGEELATSS